MDRQTLLDLHFKFVTNIVALQEIQWHVYKRILAQDPEKRDPKDEVTATKEAGRVLGYLDCCEIVLNLIREGGEYRGVSTERRS